MAKGFTNLSVENLKPGAERRELPDPSARGLYLVVQPSGRKGFAVRYRYGGKPKKLTLKAGISLAAARKEAAAALYEVEQGRDPATSKQEAKDKAKTAVRDTLRAVWELYLKIEGKKLRSIDQRIKAFDRLILPVLGARSVSSIKRSEITALLDGIQVDNGPRMAHVVLAYLSKLFNWHAAREDDFKSPIIRGMGRVNAKERARVRVLDDDELRAVWAAAKSDSGISGRFIQFLLLTAARRGEAAKMTWDEIKGFDWVLPASRNKAKFELTRPLSKTAAALIQDVDRIEGCPYIFTADGVRAISGFGNLKAKIDDACGVGGWTIHDLRRTARSLMSRAGVESDFAERCLGHTIPGIRGIYDRHSYRPQMLHAYEELAALIERIVHPVDNVVALRGVP